MPFSSWIDDQRRKATDFGHSSCSQVPGPVLLAVQMESNSLQISRLDHGMSYVTKEGIVIIMVSSFCLVGCRTFGVDGDFLRYDAAAVGNARFREMVNNSLDDYARGSRKLEKTKVVKSIIETIRKNCLETSGGGFVRQVRLNPCSCDLQDDRFFHEDELTEGFIFTGCGVRKLVWGGTQDCTWEDFASFEGCPQNKGICKRKWSRIETKLDTNETQRYG